MNAAQKEFVTTINSIESLTHDVKRYRVTKPAGYCFEPGQATDLAINSPELRNEKRPFTFTGLNDWTELEFIIKTYDDHNGITAKLSRLNAGDELIIGEPWGAITYKGPGTFIAGGAGITPFIAILRELKRHGNVKNNRLLFSNKALVDVILHEELRELLGSELIITLTEEALAPYENRMIGQEFIKQYITNPTGHFYICGPPGMMSGVGKALAALHIGEDRVVVEM